MKTLLHIGCGEAPKPDGYATYRETRLDCEPTYEPDILASCAAMPMIADQFFDAVYASHVLEHLYAHEAAMAFAEMFRVLKPGGFAEVFVPDIQAIGGKLALDEADQPLYLSNIGPVSPLDMLYGHRASVASGRPAMAHRTGFTASVLRGSLLRAGFVNADVGRLNNRGSPELRAVAFRPQEQTDAGQESGAASVSDDPLRQGLDATA